MSLDTIASNITELLTALTGMLSTFTAYWFVFLPITFTVFGFLFGKFKSLLMYRKRSNRRSGG